MNKNKYFLVKTIKKTFLWDPLTKYINKQTYHRNISTLKLTHKQSSSGSKTWYSNHMNILFKVRRKEDQSRSFSNLLRMNK